MRPFELLVVAALAVGPAVGVPLHGGLPGGQFHGGPVPGLHVVVDSAIGLVVGVALVALYLAVLRRIGGPDSADEPEPEPEPPSPGRKSGGP